MRDKRVIEVVSGGKGSMKQKVSVSTLTSAIKKKELKMQEGKLNGLCTIFMVQ